jgi:hypothetical protein
MSADPLVPIIDRYNPGHPEHPLTFDVEAARRLEAQLESGELDEKRYKVLRKKLEPARPVIYMPLSQALTAEHDSDAHIACYSVPDFAYRLTREIIRKRPIIMVAALFEYDCPAVHGTKDPAPDGWRRQQRGKIFDLLHDHPGALQWDTRGGGKLIYGLLPRTLLTLEHMNGWKRLYTGWCNCVERKYGLKFDRACKDWQRLQRLPFVVRDGNRERHATMGDPSNIGEWVCRLAADDLPVKKTTSNARGHWKPAGSVGYGALHAAFQRRGWIDREKDPGVSWVVRCPFEIEHTTGDTYDGSTVLYAADTAKGRSLGWVHCLHGHCIDRSGDDYRKAFSAEELRT